MSADISSRPKVTNVNFKDATFFDLINDPNHKNYPLARFP